MDFIGKVKIDEFLKVGGFFLAKKVWISNLCGLVKMLLKGNKIWKREDKIWIEFIQRDEILCAFLQNELT